MKGQRRGKYLPLAVLRKTYIFNHHPQISSSASLLLVISFIIPALKSENGLALFIRPPFEVWMLSFLDEAIDPVLLFPYSHSTYQHCAQSLGRDSEFMALSNQM